MAFFTQAEKESIANDLRFANHQGIIDMLTKIDTDMGAAVESVVGVVGDFGEVVDPIALTASATFDETELQAVADKLDALIAALTTMGIVTATPGE